MKLHSEHWSTLATPSVPDHGIPSLETVTNLWLALTVAYLANAGGRVLLRLPR